MRQAILIIKTSDGLLIGAVIFPDMAKAHTARMKLVSKYDCTGRIVMARHDTKSIEEQLAVDASGICDERI